MTRRFLRRMCCGLVGALLMAQMAVAAYACPALSVASAAHMPMPSASASPAEQGPSTAGRPMVQMADCDDMAGMWDAASPNLCAEHCKYGQQSDQAATLSLPSAVFTALYVTPPVRAAEPPRRPAADTLSARVAASPPHAILHCVHRI